MCSYVLRERREHVRSHWGRELSHTSRLRVRFFILLSAFKIIEFMPWVTHHVTWTTFWGDKLGQTDLYTRLVVSDPSHKNYQTF